jgi:hypothetical protein
MRKYFMALLLMMTTVTTQAQDFSFDEVSYTP